MLLNTNILNFERINIDVDEEKLLIRSCNDLIMNIKIKIKNNINVRRIIRNQKRMTIFFNSMMRIFIELRISTLLSDRDYLFKFNYTGIYAHIMLISLDITVTADETNH